MGYYSDVAVAMKKSDFREMLRQINEVTNDSQDIAVFIRSAYKYNAEDDFIVLSWEFVKWYDDFPEVQFISDFLRYLRESGKPYEFIRLGEDLGDCEHDDFGDLGMFYPKQSIDFVSDNLQKFDEKE